MKASLLLSLLSLNAFALDCAGIPEGKVVRLDQNNGPLSKAAIQDQDGVGSCYANQGSLMLQSVIPGNPNLSYLNLGLYYATDYTVPNYLKRGYKTYNHYEQANAVIDGGFSCKAINAALARQKSSGAGVLCKAEDVMLEHSFINTRGEATSNNTTVALSASAKYMSAFQHQFGWADEGNSEKLQVQRAKADQFKNALKKFVKDSGDTYFNSKCTQSDPEKMVKMLDNAFTRAINDNPECISGKTLKSTGSICQNFSQFGMIVPLSGGTGNSSKVAFLQNKANLDKLRASIPSLFKTTAGMPSFLSGLSDFIKSSDKSKSSEKEKDAFAQMIVKSISPENMRGLESDYDRLALKNFDKCKGENVLAFFQDREFSKKVSQDVVLCNYKTLLSSAQLLAQTLPKGAFSDMNDFIDFITEKAGLKYDQAMLSLIANDCSPDKRVSIPDNLKCDQVAMDFKAGDFRHGSTAPVTAEAAEVIKNNRARMLSSIDEKRAFGVTLCTKYWKDPSYGYNSYPTREQRSQTCVNGRDSFHSIAAIGYRCKNNKIQYLAQNSWGPNWKEENKQLEIENGKVWLDEDAMFQNLETIDYMSL